MMSWSAEFDGGPVLSSGVTLQHTRAYATVDFAGRAVVPNQPVFSKRQTFVSPPRASDVVTLDATSSTTNVPAAVGRWSDGVTPCAVHYRATSITRVSIHVGTAIATNAFVSAAARNCDILCTSTPDATFNPSGRKNGLNDLLRGAGASAGEAGDWVYIPRAWQVEEGGIFALCEAAEWDGSSAYQSRAIALVRWDDTVAGGSGTNKFTLVFRGPSVQNGQGRGQQWAMPQAFNLGTQYERWLTFTDYRTNPNATGGQSYIVRLTKDGPNAPYVPGVVAPFMSFTGNATGSGIHFHCVGIMPWKAGMAAILVVGDTANSQTIVATREDRNHLQGHTLTAADRTPSSVTWLVSLPTDPTLFSASGGNGWTVYPYAGGNPFSTVNGAAFTGATWTDAGRTLAVAALNTATIGDRTGGYVVITGGTGVTGPTLAKITAHSGTTLTLDRDINGGSGNASDIAGTVCSPQACHQPVACHQLPDGRLWFGSDESTPVATICNLPTFNSNDLFIRWEQVEGRTLTTHGREWNTFQSVSDQASPERLYAGVYTSSIGVGGWNSLTPPGRVMVGGREGMAAIYQPNQSNASSNARMGVYRVSDSESWLLYGPVSNSVFAIRAPRWMKTVRPMIASSPAITQHLTAGPYTELGSSTPSTYEVVDRAALPTLVQGHPIPPPPANGPVIRTSSRGPYSFLRVLTGVTLATNAKVTLTGWLYVLPPAAPNGDIGAASFAATLQVGDGTNVGTAVGRSVFQTLNRTDGYGWQRITFDCGLPSSWSGGGASVNPCPVSLALRTQNGNVFAVADMLFVPESIISGNVEIPAIAPPVAGNVAYAEATTRLNVPRSALAWTFTGAFAIPPHSSDEYLSNRNTSRALFTLSDGTKYLKVTADPSNHRISVTDGTNTINCAAPAGQEMNFDRKGQVYIGLSLTGTTLTVVASVDGTVLNSQAGTIIPLQYDRILSGDENNANGEPLMWWLLRGWDRFVAAGSELGDMLNGVGSDSQSAKGESRERVIDRGGWWRRVGRRIGITKRP